MLLSINEVFEYMLDEGKKKFYIIYNYLMKQKRLKYLIITSLGSRVEIFRSCEWNVHLIDLKNIRQLKFFLYKIQKILFILFVWLNDYLIYNDSEAG